MLITKIQKSREVSTLGNTVDYHVSQLDAVATIYFTARFCAATI